MLDRPGGVFVRRRDLLEPDELLMLRATARVHIPCDGRALGRILAAAMATEEATEEELDIRADEPRAPARSDSRVIRAVKRIGATLPTLLGPLTGPLTAPGHLRRRRTQLDEADPADFKNGFGALRADGDYVLRVAGDRIPPAPWSNVIANPHGGFVVTERGGGFTWAENSYFFRLTPWHNDPVGDPVGEAVYLRDSDTGELWCATPGPVPVDTAFTVRHGAGESSFAHTRHGIATHYTLGMADGAAVKLGLLEVTNDGDRTRAPDADDVRGVDPRRHAGAHAAPDADRVRRRSRRHPGSERLRSAVRRLDGVSGDHASR